MKIRFLAILLALFTSPGITAECRDDSLHRLIRDSKPGVPFLLVTESRTHLRLYGQDLIDPREWQKGDPLSVCVDAQGPNTFDIHNLRLKQTLVGYDEAKVGSP